MGGRPFSSWEETVSWLIEQTEYQALVQDCYFDRPALLAAQRFRSSDEWIAVRRLLPAHPGHVLDLGAGMGIASYALAQDGWQVTALEPDPSELVGAAAIRRLAREAGLDIAVIESFGERLPFDDESFDVIHARQVLHHAHDLGGVCAECFRVLKPGGCLIAAREHVISNREQLQAFLKKHPLHALYGGENAYRREEYLACIRAPGFVMRNTLGPWATVINFAPFTRHRLEALFLSRFGRWPLATAMARVAFSEHGFQLGRRILSVVDRRPGRLFTFVADKPGARM